jgi:hypothetical protein
MVVSMSKCGPENERRMQQTEEEMALSTSTNHTLPSSSSAQRHGTAVPEAIGVEGAARRIRGQHATSLRRQLLASVHVNW